MSSNGIARVQYFDRQFLRPQDFSNEQAYHIAMRRRHNLAHHTWGIVRGLDIVTDPDGNLFVQPGIAIDGYGRELILGDRRAITPREFALKGSALDVFLVYTRKTSEPPAPGYSGCGPSAPHPDSRAEESALVRFEKPDLSYPDRRQPKYLAPADYQFDATRMPKDDPSALWPVFLGQVTSAGPTGQTTYTANPADRPYAGLVGEGILAPSGSARLQLGVPLPGTKLGAGRKQPPESGFAVFVSPADEYKLAVDAGRISINGDAQLYGNLTVKSGAVEFAGGTPVIPRPAPIQAAQPWKISRDPEGRQLRIEMAPGAAGAPNSVAIGAFDPDKKQFMPCFTVDDQKNVTVEGDLIVQGKLQAGQMVSAGLSKEAQDYVLSGLLSGVGGSSAVLDRIFKVPATGAITAMAAAVGDASFPLSDFATELKTRFPRIALNLKALL